MKFQFLNSYQQRLMNDDPGASGGGDADEIKNPEGLLVKNKELLKKLADQKTENEKLIRERDEAEQARKKKEEDELRAKEDYKTLYERSEREKKEASDREKALKDNLEKGAKLAKVQDELTKLGINPERLNVAMRLIDLGSVKYDDSLKVVSGADVEASRIKMLTPELFGARDPEKDDSGHPGNNRPGKMTEEQYLALPRDEQKKMYAKMMKDVYGIDVKR